MRISLTSFSCFQVVFQVRISRCDLCDMSHMFRADRCSSQVGMKNRSSSIDHCTHIRRMHCFHSNTDIVCQCVDLSLCLFFFFASADICTKFFHLPMDCFHNRLTAVSFDHILNLFLSQQYIHFRDTAV